MDECYTTFNVRGDGTGNCGYTSTEFIACSARYRAKCRPVVMLYLVSVLYVHQDIWIPLLPFSSLFPFLNPLLLSSLSPPSSPFSSFHSSSSLSFSFSFSSSPSPSSPSFSSSFPPHLFLVPLLPLLLLSPCSPPVSPSSDVFCGQLDCIVGEFQNRFEVAVSIVTLSVFVPALLRIEQCK